MSHLGLMKDPMSSSLIFICKMHEVNVRQTVRSRLLPSRNLSNLESPTKDKDQKIRIDYLLVEGSNLRQLTLLLASDVGNLTDRFLNENDSYRREARNDRKTKMKKVCTINLELFDALFNGAQSMHELGAAALLKTETDRIRSGLG